MTKLRLTIDLNVFDEEALVAFARKRADVMWGTTLEELMTTETLVQCAAYEALVASTPGEFPDGLEITSKEFA